MPERVNSPHVRNLMEKRAAPDLVTTARVRNVFAITLPIVYAAYPEAIAAAQTVLDGMEGEHALKTDLECLRAILKPLAVRDTPFGKAAHAAKPEDVLVAIRTVFLYVNTGEFPTDSPRHLEWAQARLNDPAA